MPAGCSNLRVFVSIVKDCFLEGVSFVNWEPCSQTMMQISVAPCGDCAVFSLASDKEVCRFPYSFYLYHTNLYNADVFTKMPQIPALSPGSGVWSTSVRGYTNSMNDTLQFYIRSGTFSKHYLRRKKYLYNTECVPIQ